MWISVLLQKMRNSVFAHLKEPWVLYLAWPWQTWSHIYRDEWCESRSRLIPEPFSRTKEPAFVAPLLPSMFAERKIIEHSVRMSNWRYSIFTIKTSTATTPRQAYFAFGIPVCHFRMPIVIGCHHDILEFLNCILNLGRHKQTRHYHLIEDI